MKFFENIKIFLGEDNEIVQSTNAAFEERISSPFYGYFMVSWVLTNWKILYVAFFVNQEFIFKSSEVLRHQYLASTLPKYPLVNFILYPFLGAWVFTWISPYITRPFYRKYIQNKKRLNAIKITEMTEIIKAETNLIKAEVKKKQEEKTAEQEAPEVVWGKEFENFKESKIFRKFDQVIECIYEKRGYLDTGRFKLDTDMVIYLDTHELINYDSVNQISLTPKGKYFVSLFSDLKNRVNNLI